MYQAILFDLDDTLFSLRGCEAQALLRTLDDAGLLSALPADFAEAYATISSGYWAARSADGDSQYSREDVIELSWRDFLSRHDLDANRSAELATQFWREFCRATALNPGAQAVSGQVDSEFAAFELRDHVFLQTFQWGGLPASAIRSKSSMVKQNLFSLSRHAVSILRYSGNLSIALFK